MASPRLALDALACGRGERTLFTNVSLDMRPGDVVRVHGPNGSGKTTLLRAVAGLAAPWAGHVRWHDDTAADTEAATRYAALCYVGHDNALNPALTPVENLDLLMRIAARPVASATIRAVLAELGLKRVARRACARLSAGQRRRVSLARLWLSDAALWLLDEPVAALDHAARAVVGARIAAHARAGGLVLFTTHEPLALPGVTPQAIELAPC